MFKQPRVPTMKDGTRLYDYIRELALFLKDFCMDAWTASKRQDEEIKKIRDEIEQIRQGGG